HSQYLQSAEQSGIGKTDKFRHRVPVLCDAGNADGIRPPKSIKASNNINK
ncbi:8242_t:CDS:2, partial [Gigaspora margarita]